jgi:hypothetical protein
MKPHVGSSNQFKLYLGMYLQAITAHEFKTAKALTAMTSNSKICNGKK